MRYTAAFLILFLMACGGGGSSTPTVVPTPVPTPTPVSYTGSYSGIMLYNVQGLAEVRYPARVTVTHTGNNLDFSNLVVTTPTTSAQYPVGNASLNGNTFTGTFSYNSSGCNVVTVTTDGRFAGTLMNLHMIQDSSNPRNCPRSELRGELSR